MGRHASWAEKLGFVLLGGPYRAIRLVVREGQRGPPLMIAYGRCGGQTW
jgi:hypothetical protein